MKPLKKKKKQQLDSALGKKKSRGFGNEFMQPKKATKLTK